MNIYLKPCPFCGGEASLYGGTNFETGRSAYYVECSDPLCPVCPTTPTSDLIAYKTEAKAAEAWNTRAEPRTCATCYYYQTTYDHGRPTDRRACFGEHLHAAVGGLDWDEEAEAWAETEPEDFCSKWAPK